MYHKLSIEETLKAFDVNPETGLSDKEAHHRTSQSTAKSDGSSFFKFAARSISHPVIIILFISAILYAVLGGWLEALLIAAVIILHTVFSAECKRRGERTLDRSVSASVTHAIVLRNGAKMKLSSDRLVVGDVVTLKPGRVVPADLRLISTENLVIDESSLTGRARAEKDCDYQSTSDVRIEFRDNCAFEGTVVLEGRGDGVVTATGMSTEMSRLTLPLDVPEKDTSPSFSRIEKLTRRLSIITSLACVAVFAISLAYDAGFMTALLASASLAVAAIPESFGTIVLTSLARGAEKLRLEGFSAKNMRAAEMLGEVNIFTTELPKMGVAATYSSGRIHSPQEEDTVPFLEGLLLCELKNPSLYAFASHKCDAENVAASFPRIGEYMGEVTTTLHRAGETTISYTGGNAAEILSRSSLIWDFGRVRTLTASDREEIEECIRTFEEEGYTQTALGLRSGDDVPCDSNLIFLGIAATRAEVNEAANPDTAALNAAGVRVLLLTEGDAEKARLGATALKIPCDNIICSRELSSLSDEDISERINDTFVFASLRAQDKVRIINVLKSYGYSVASVGDGISDAPALDASDVGMSELHASDAAKDASDVVFDGSFSADRAIIRGKIIRTNIRRAVTYLAAANTAELICVLLSAACGFGFPLTALQILLVNLITDTFPALLLVRGGFLQKNPSRMAYIWGTVLGLLMPFVFRVLTQSTGLFLAQWITFAALTVGELLLVLPMYFAGRRK